MECNTYDTDTILIPCPKCHSVIFEPDFCIFCETSISPSYLRTSVKEKLKQFDATTLNSKNPPRYLFHPSVSTTNLAHILAVGASRTKGKVRTFNSKRPSVIKEKVKDSVIKEALVTSSIKEKLRASSTKQKEGASVIKETVKTSSIKEALRASSTKEKGASNATKVKEGVINTNEKYGVPGTNEKRGNPIVKGKEVVSSELEKHGVSSTKEKCVPSAKEKEGVSNLKEKYEVSTTKGNVENSSAGENKKASSTEEIKKASSTEDKKKAYSTEEKKKASSTEEKKTAPNTEEKKKAFNTVERKTASCTEGNAGSSSIKEKVVLFSTKKGTEFYSANEKLVHFSSKEETDLSSAKEKVIPSSTKKKVGDSSTKETTFNIGKKGSSGAHKKVGASRTSTYGFTSRCSHDGDCACAVYLKSAEEIAVLRAEKHKEHTDTERDETKGLDFFTPLKRRETLVLNCTNNVPKRRQLLQLNEKVESLCELLHKVKEASFVRPSGVLEMARTTQHGITSNISNGFSWAEVKYKTLTEELSTKVFSLRTVSPIEREPLSMPSNDIESREDSVDRLNYKTATDEADLSTDEVIFEKHINPELPETSNTPEINSNKHDVVSPEPELLKTSNMPETNSNKHDLVSPKSELPKSSNMPESNANKHDVVSPESDLSKTSNTPKTNTNKHDVVSPKSELPNGIGKQNEVELVSEIDHKNDKAVVNSGHNPVEKDSISLHNVPAAGESDLINEVNIIGETIVGKIDTSIENLKTCDKPADANKLISEKEDPLNVSKNKAYSDSVEKPSKEIKQRARTKRKAEPITNTKYLRERKQTKISEISNQVIDNSLLLNKAKPAKNRISDEFDSPVESSKAIKNSTITEDTVVDVCCISDDDVDPQPSKGFVDMRRFNQQVSCISINRKGTSFPKLSPGISISFRAQGINIELPKYKASSQTYDIMLKKSDVELVYSWLAYHWCFISVITSSQLGEDIKENLKTCKVRSPYYNPDTESTTQLQISFLLQNITAEITDFLSNVFQGKINHIKQKEGLRMITSKEQKKARPPPLSFSSSLVYPLVNGIEVKTADIDTLAPGKYLNDTIIDFYLLYVYHEKISIDLQVKTHVFSSLFYNTLLREFGKNSLNRTEAELVERINKRTKNVDVFSKDYIFIPIGYKGHWYLVLLAFLTKLLQDDEDVVLVDESNGAKGAPETVKPDDKRQTRKQSEAALLHKSKPCICFFDSSDSSPRLNGNKFEVALTLKHFLKVLWKSKQPERICDWDKLLLLKARCPQQKNTYDCGIYLLQYVESFLEKPIPLQDPLPDLRNWFLPEVVRCKRNKIKNLICQLKKKQAEMGIQPAVDYSDIMSPVVDISDVMDVT